MKNTLTLFFLLAVGAACTGGCDSDIAVPPACQFDYQPPYLGPGELVWALHAGSQSFIWGLSTVQMPDHSVLVLGIFENTAVFGSGQGLQASITSRGSSDIFLARFCADGSLGWVRSAGGTGVDLGIKLAVLPDEDVLVFGTFEGSAAFGKKKKNQTVLQTGKASGAFLARYDREGVLRWARLIGETNAQTPTMQAPGNAPSGLAVTGDGSILIASGFSSSIWLAPGQPGETLLTARGDQDMVLFLLDPGGDLVWAEQAGGNGDVFPQGCFVLTDGTSFITGGFSQTVRFGTPENDDECELTSAGNYDIFLARYEPDGSLGWVRQAGGSADYWEWGDGITGDGAGNLYVVGDFSRDATFGAGESNETTLSVIEEHDLFLARYDSGGSLQWVRQLGGIARGYGLTPSSGGTVVVAGKFFETITPGAGGPNETVLQSAGEADIVVAKYGSDGGLRWAKRAGGTGMDLPSGIAGDASGFSTVTGGFQGAAQFGGGETGETWLRANGEWDFFVMRLSP